MCFADLCDEGAGLRNAINRKLLPQLNDQQCFLLNVVTAAPQHVDLAGRRLVADFVYNMVECNEDTAMFHDSDGFNITVAADVVKIWKSVADGVHGGDFMLRYTCLKTLKVATMASDDQVKIISNLPVGDGSLAKVLKVRFAQ
jgi:hypothetical protein